MQKHFIFDKLSDKKNRLKIALQVSKLAFSPIVMPMKISAITVLVCCTNCMKKNLLIDMSIIAYGHFCSIPRGALGEYLQPEFRYAAIQA